jgi:hypothetical protein
MRTYYEQRYCNECVMVHWLEVTPARKEICHGEEFYPHSTPTHYTRRLGRGVEMIEKQSYNLPLVWQMALEAQADERETIDQSQDW